VREVHSFADGTDERTVYASSALPRRGHRTDHLDTPTRVLTHSDSLRKPARRHPPTPTSGTSRASSRASGAATRPSRFPLQPRRHDGLERRDADGYRRRMTFRGAASPAADPLEAERGGGERELLTLRYVKIRKAARTNRRRTGARSRTPSRVGRSRRKEDAVGTRAFFETRRAGASASIRDGTRVQRFEVRTARPHDEDPDSEDSKGREFEYGRDSGRVVRAANDWGPSSSSTTRTRRVVQRQGTFEIRRRSIRSNGLGSRIARSGPEGRAPSVRERRARSCGAIRVRGGTASPSRVERDPTLAAGLPERRQRGGARFGYDELVDSPSGGSRQRRARARSAV
jgi:hypothetical protein